MTGIFTCVASRGFVHHSNAHSPLDPGEIRHLASVRRRTTPLQDLLRPRSQAKAALQLHPSPSWKRSLPTGYSALTRGPGHGRLSLSPGRQANISPDWGRRLLRRGIRTAWLAGAFPAHAPLGWPRGLGFAPQKGWGHFGLVRPSTGPQDVSRVAEGGVGASKWKTEKIPPSSSPEPLPPSGHGAPGNLPSKRPPHTNTHKHTHTVRRSLAWRGWGRKRSERRGCRLPFQAGSRALEKFFPPTGVPETPTGGFPGHCRGRQM